MNMKAYEYGNSNARVVLLQPVDDHDLSVIDAEVQALSALTNVDFHLIAMKVENWNRDLSPWRAPAVFGNEDFGDGAAETLAEILERCTDPDKTYFIGGYSLAGLFSLWAAYQTNAFEGVAAASPSVWFPGFNDYMRTHEIRSKAVCLSLGDREERTRNPVMAKVGDCIRQDYETLKAQGIHCSLEWNRGNHFREPDLRTAKAFAWLLNHFKNEKTG